MHSKSTRKLAPATLLAAALAGCGTVTTHTPGGKELVMSQEEFGKYVERVFRYHNRVMNELIESADDSSDLDASEAQRLSAAEAKMVEVCHLLNEAVSESQSGKSLGLQTEMALIDSVPACEAATQAVDDLMP
jgi:hypothetical protein